MNFVIFGEGPMTSASRTKRGGKQCIRYDHMMCGSWVYACCRSLWDFSQFGLHIRDCVPFLLSERLPSSGGTAVWFPFYLLSSFASCGAQADEIKLCSFYPFDLANLTPN